MRTYTQEDLDSLIHCEKVVSEAPKKEMWSERGSLRNNMKAKSRDGAHDFSVFMRINEDFNENFSIGMEYSPKEERGSICLLRCNGPHGEHINEVLSAPAHIGYHIHWARAVAVNAGSKAERYAEQTSEYASFREALSYFFKVAHIVDAEQYFPGVGQFQLFDGKEG